MEVSFFFGGGAYASSIYSILPQENLQTIVLPQDILHISQEFSQQSDTIEKQDIMNLIS